MPWQSAHDLLKTDWEAIDPRATPRPGSAPAEATIPCGLMMNNGRGDCPEMFFTEEGRDRHHSDPPGKLYAGHGLSPTDFGGIDRGKALAERSGDKPLGSPFPDMPGDTRRGMRRNER